MNLDEFNYKEEIEIDPDNLDLECLRQAALFLKYSELLADAEKNLDRAKRNHDRISSGVAKKVREDPKKYIGDAKLTEAWLNNIVDSDKEVDDSGKVVDQCKHLVRRLSNIVSAFEQKKRSINNLVQLNGQQYFAGPSTERQLNREFVKKTRDSIAKDKIREKMQQKNAKIEYENEEKD